MKKFLIFFMIMIFIFPINIFADDIENEVNDSQILDVVSKVNEEPTINSRAAIVYDRNSKEIIYGKEEKSIRKMASTTKIMTATIVIENCNLSDIVIVSDKSAGTGGSRLGLKSKDKITVNDLLYGLMLCSGNDAAVALAEHVGGSIQGFAEMMNKKAQELELKNTHFVTPHGLDNDEHYTTAYELAKLTDYALRNKTFLKLVSTKNCTITINGNSKNIKNTNELLGNLEGVYGVKTGFTNGANRCLVTATKRGNLDIITIVLGADTKKFRTQDSIKLINYAFNNFETVNIENIMEHEFELWKSKNENNINVYKGMEKLDLNLNMPDITYITIKKDQKENIKIYINSLNIIEAPIQNGSIVGNLYIKVEDELKIVTQITNNREIRRKNIYDYFKFFIKNYMNVNIFNNA